MPANGIKGPESLAIGKSETSGAIYLTLAGRMTGNGIGELRRELEEARRRRRPVQLDLSEVTLLDRVSADFLNSVACPMVRLENCPEYLRRWIGESRTSGA
jgi:hypothetical protein